ncbi:hypothetical protein JVT61DRAFT_4652 [Boletus reticuloceps]|uniref:Uncharacterized protein n=1 Tax=Boletus reticuloceps TaxID=495285 RepID=A0A8I3A5R0_9AGAM|nr:hypothetical protein JVT61DRAFT_11117 [Boletus reticuloceps]KAG6374016.1 hypothetical protein JVT61DRAFT_4652 [Boletus reticuloceps]
MDDFCQSLQEEDEHRRLQQRAHEQVETRGWSGQADSRHRVTTFPRRFTRAKCEALNMDLFSHGHEAPLSRFPRMQMSTRTTLMRAINADEAVAYGAMDVNHLAFGIETTGGVFTKLIARNIIPTRKSQIYGRVRFYCFSDLTANCAHPSVTSVDQGQQLPWQV